MKPQSRPKLELDNVLAHLQDKGLSDAVKDQPFYLVGIRGYYTKTFGDPLVNDRIYYDDALIIAGRGVYITFNFNTDPSIFKKGVAVLKANEVYEVVRHNHKGNALYPALQIVKDIVIRDGSTAPDIGRHGINFHWDYEHYSKFSLGCQTLPKSQWDEFQRLVYDLMRVDKLTTIKYVLIDA